jgi:hypothetical protein
MQDRYMFCAERTTGSEIILNAPDELLGDVRHVESHFGPFGERVLVSVQDGRMFCLNVPRVQRSFWMHSMELLGAWVMWNLILVRLVTMLVLIHLEIVLVSMQDWCTICAKHTIGLEMILTHLIVTPR